MNEEVLFKQVLCSLNAPSAAYEDFKIYRRLLLEWNQRMNLVSKNDESRIIHRHFIDSLALLNAVEFHGHFRVLDMGTGAGFPGIPIRLVKPDIDLTVLESKRKKGLFLNQLLSELNLAHDVSVIIGRAEACTTAMDPFDMVCSRAMADASALIRLGAPYLKPSGGRIVALKSAHAKSELHTIPRTVNNLSVQHAELIRCEAFQQLMPGKFYFVLDVQLGPIFL